MLSNPRFGFCKFELEGFVGAPSYLSNVPFDIITSFNKFFKDYNPVVIQFEEEPGDFFLIITYKSCYIISDREDLNILLLEKDAVDLANEVVKDIESSIETWFDEFCLDKEDSLDNLKQELFRLKQRLKEID